MHSRKEAQTIVRPFTFSVICGLTAFTTKNHIIRAALETVCYQITDVIEAMKKDAGIHLTKLHVDGKMTRNNLLMQLQADISGIPIREFYRLISLFFRVDLILGVFFRLDFSKITDERYDECGLCHRSWTRRGH